MAGVIATIPKFQFSANGVPMVGGTLDTYIAGSTTPATTWQDSALTIANTNPISLDALGECVLWLDSTKSYKFVLKNASGVIQWTQDNISGAGSLADKLRTDLAASSGASLVGYDGDTAQAVLDDAKPMANYTALRAYTGRATGVRITTPGIAGIFQRDATDTTSADNGGTIIVDASGRRWKRLFDGHQHWCEWFGARPTPGFDNGPALRAAKNAAEAIGTTNAAPNLRIGQGTFEVSTAEADGSSGVRFNKAGGIYGLGYFGTIFQWKTATANRPLFLVQPTVETPLPSWRARLEDFSVWASLGAAHGSAILINPASPSASLGFRVAGVRVKGCQDGIAVTGNGGVTVYGGTVQDCSVEDIVNTGRGFYFSSAAYCELKNCEAYPLFEGGGGETAYCFYFNASWSKTVNCRAAGAVYADAPGSSLDFTIEGQGSTCQHNSDAAIRVNRCNSVKASILGGRITGQASPAIGLYLQDANNVIEFLEIADVSGFSSPKTPLQLSGNATLLMGKAGGVGVLKPEDDINTGLDPTFGGKLRIVNGGTWTNYGKWTAAYDPPSIAAGASATTALSCAGAQVGTAVVASFSNPSADIEITATVTSLGNVQVRFSNRGAGPVDLAAGTIYAAVVPRS